mgnify:CR=1 FL=1
MEGIEESAGGLNLKKLITGTKSNCVSISDAKLDFSRSKHVKITFELPSGRSKFVELELNAKTPENLKSELLASEVNELDAQALCNLLQVKLVEHKLANAIKKCLLRIQNFSAQEIFELQQTREPQLEEDPQFKFLISLANEKANSITDYIETKHEKVNNMIDWFPLEVFERKPLVATSKEELFDNLNRKYILVVNQLNELRRGHSVSESHLTSQVADLINNL